MRINILSVIKTKCCVRYQNGLGNCYLDKADFYTVSTTFSNTENEMLEIILTLRKETSAPVWAIKKCLELSNGDVEEAKERLRNVYAVWGDRPQTTIKKNEDSLREFM